MNNEQNEKLCKLLRVESRYKVVVEGMKSPKAKWFMTGETFATKQEAQNYIDRIITPYKKAYATKFDVDLSAPSNFVRLLEIIIKTGIFFAPSYYKSTNEYSDYWQKTMICGHTLPEFTVNLLITVLTKEDLKTEFTQEIQQQAQQTKWVY